MLTLRFDGSGLYQVQWPKKSSEILELGRLYVEYELKQSPAAQLVLPSLAMVQTSLQAAKESHELAGRGEANRAQSAGVYRQTLNALKSKLEIALLQLKANQMDNLAALQQWGLKTVVKGKKIVVYKPQGPLEWEQFAEAYVRREESSPPAGQLATPPLAEVKSLWNALKQSKETRNEGRNSREIGVQTRSVEINRLLDLLQLAAAGLVITRFYGQVTNELQLWGFKVTAVPVKAAAKEEEAVLA